MEIGVWFGILLSAVLAFLLGAFYGQPLHWYLFILIIVTGFFYTNGHLNFKSKG
ncbi:hypothetical protein OL548_08530 [Lysinibacillus sp. MHQ-1]|nr:hypothetical protein OL548_08530 [Lysinibacillus sp. MHQ-1]